MGSASTELDVLKIVYLVLTRNEHHALASNVMQRFCKRDCLNSEWQDVSLTHYFRLAFKGKTRVLLCVYRAILAKEIFTK
jgi:hypothetical protein